LDQSLFEQHQGVSAGKYTIGLGLKYMNFCDDREGKFPLMRQIAVVPLRLRGVARMPRDAC
jgi:hypothetical protein